MPLVSSRDRMEKNKNVRSRRSRRDVGGRLLFLFLSPPPLSLLAEARKVFRKTIKRDTRDHETLNRGDRVLPSPYAS